ncbi:MAG: hypothetical protein K9N00_06935 [Candidatus Marinimicrobia bacterium]|nr:hypothetical protein [Candidatus Neomarinimicrobiota bacterium]
MFQKNNIKLYNLDFLKNYQLIPENSVDLFLTDPPYGIFPGNQNLTGVIDKSINLEKLEIILDYLLKDNGQAILFCNLELLIEIKQKITNNFEFL